MGIQDYTLVALFLGSLPVCCPLLGRYIARVFDGQRPLRLWGIASLERAIYRGCGIDPFEPMTWRSYAGSLLLFSGAGAVALLAMQLVQNRLPLNPAHLGAVPFSTALNTAVSFATNTDWQAYAGETTMSYLTQMAGLAVQNFVSAGAAIAVVVALARGIAGKNSVSIGNFWSDLVKSVLYILLPLSVILAVALIGQGSVQTLAPPVRAAALDGREQVIPVGPVASQEAIKQLGTSGGGFFNANGAHPFENPTPLSNLLEIFAIFLLPGALAFAFGRLIGSPDHGKVLFIAMLLIFCAGLFVALHAENAWNPVLHTQGSLEGKELRFGTSGSALYAAVTTAASCGAVNCRHESLAPLTGCVAMFNIMMGEVIFGGVGSGLYSMVLYAILTFFIAGLMVGRSPEYIGKAIESFEVKMCVIGVLASPVVMLVLAAIACSTRAGTGPLGASGVGGLNEILYNFASVANNNGSAFGGMNAAAPFYSLTMPLAMLIGRFVTLLSVLGIAGHLAGKKIRPVSSGTFPTHGGLFLVLLIGTIIIVGALSFFPALSLGPLLQHLLTLSGRGA
jgi:K+-transporting ATPase ATPase A chain